jgi:hypothetical protein
VIIVLYLPNKNIDAILGYKQVVYGIMSPNFF